jgi:hypothetical protein
MGELMGWAGSGSNNPIRLPKFGLEFDSYYNSCNGNQVIAGSRCDDKNQYDHMAYVFWGSQSDFVNATTGVNYGPYTDDNRHGAGAGNASEPISFGNLDGTGTGRFGYYYQSTTNWLRGNSSSSTKYGIRYELSRLARVNAEGNYLYLLKTWVQVGAGTGDYIDVTKNYTTSPPTTVRVVHLTPDLHAKMRQVIVGWSEATGDNTQTVNVSNFNMAFKSVLDSLIAIPSDYVSYWNMNAGSGSVIADTKGVNNGAAVGTAVWITPPSYSYGNALKFLNNDWRVSVTDSSSLDLTSAGAISVWIYPTALTDDTFILHKGRNSDATGEAYSLAFSSGGKLQLLLRNSPSKIITLDSSALPAINRWYHVVAQWDDKVMAIYINGMLNNIASNTLPAQVTDGNSARLIIGARHTQGAGPYKGFNGYIDELYLYNRWLTAEEIAALSTLP